eukprot:PhF_6_TR23128/c0_g1_i1/m.32526
MDVCVTKTVEVRNVTASRKCRWCSNYSTWDHEPKCAQRDVECEACGALLKAKGYSAHVVECHSRYSECDLCHGVLLKTHVKNHVKRCAYRTVVCRHCSITTTAVEYVDHRAECPNR